MTLNLRNFKRPEVEVETYKLVGFTVRDIHYGIDIMRVREVINPIPLMAVPSLPSYIKGVADHRGEVVPVIDLRSRFGIEPALDTAKIKWLIVQIEDRNVALQVDWVTEVIALAPSDRRERMPSAYVEKPWIRNVFQQTDHLVFELDLPVVVSPAVLKVSSEGGGGRVP